MTTLARLTMILFSVLLFIPNILQASDWIRIDGSTEKESTQYLFDIENVTHNESTATFWAKTINPDKSYELVRFSINCAKKEFKGLDKIKYTNNGKEIVADDLHSIWIGIPPDSFIDTLKGIVCDHNKPRPLKDLVIFKGYRQYLIDDKEKEK